MTGVSLQSNCYSKVNLYFLSTLESDAAKFEKLKFSFNVHFSYVILIYQKIFLWYFEFLSFTPRSKYSSLKI